MLASFTVVFMLPHILASMFTFFDREYLALYRRRLSWGIPAALIASFAMTRSGLGAEVFWALTLWHVMTQQVGIARTFARHWWGFTVWRWLLVAAFTCGGVGIDYPSARLPASVLQGVSLLMVMPVLLRCRHRTGIYYIAGTQGTVMIAALGIAIGYPFFTALLPRVVHDVTAFVFYVVHGHNRNRQQQPNMLLRMLSFTQVPVAVLVVVVPILLNCALGYAHLPTTSIIITLSMFHYFTEGFMWKRGAPHRKHVPIHA